MRLARHCVAAFCFFIMMFAFVPVLRTDQANAQAAPTATTQQPGTQEQAYHLPPDKLAKAIALGRIRNILHFAGEIWGLAVLWLLLATGAAAELEARADRVSHKRWLQGLAFFGALIVILTLANLPLDMYAHSVSRSYGISVQGWGSWFGDEAKALALSVVFGSLVMLLFQWIVRRWPRRYWLGVWVATLPLLLLSILVEPFFEPIFYKFEPLQKNNPALVGELETVAARTGTNIPPERMFLMQASAKTNGLNAYVSGIGSTKRIVVWDTTAGRVPDDVVMFIFGHESGHYVLNHAEKLLVLSAILLFFVYWGCARFAERLARRFGERWKLDMTAPLACRAGFVVLLFAISVAGFVVEPIVNTVSRHFEHEADVYGQEAVHGLIPDPQKTGVAAFNALGEAWLEDPNPNPLIEFWEYNHPSVKTRANFAAHYDPWANGRRGKFFEK